MHTHAYTHIHTGELLASMTTLASLNLENNELTTLDPGNVV